MSTTYTTNYHLGKQTDTSDTFDMSVITDDMDIIDTQMKNNETNISSISDTLFLNGIQKLNVNTSSAFQVLSGYYLNSDLSTGASATHKLYYVRGTGKEIYADSTTLSNQNYCAWFVITGTTAGNEISQTAGGGYKFNGSLKTKYSLSDSNIPVANTPLQLADGELLVIDITYDRTLDVYVGADVYDYNDTTKIQDIATKKLKWSKTGNKIDVYMPSRISDKYIHFAYQKITNQSINFDNWKQMDTDICDKNLDVIFNLYGSSNNVEWEGVVKEYDTVDFIGGYHGNENNEALTVMIDGQQIDMSADYNISEAVEINVVNKSSVNRYNSPSDVLFTRYKVSTWTADKYTIRNRWIARDSVNLSLVYMTMFSLPVTKGNYNVATFGRYDDKYIIQTPSGAAIDGSCLYNSSYAKTVEFWGTDFYGKCTAKYDSYSEYLCFCDRSQSNIYKGYWRQGYTGGNYKTYNTNDEINGTSEYEFIF